MFWFIIITYIHSKLEFKLIEQITWTWNKQIIFSVLKV